MFEQFINMSTDELIDNAKNKNIDFVKFLKKNVRKGELEAAQRQTGVKLDFKKLANFNPQQVKLLKEKINKSIEHFKNLSPEEREKRVLKNFTEVDKKVIKYTIGEEDIPEDEQNTISRQINFERAVKSHSQQVGEFDFKFYEDGSLKIEGLNDENKDLFNFIFKNMEEKQEGDDTEEMRKEQQELEEEFMSSDQDDEPVIAPPSKAGRRYKK